MRADQKIVVEGTLNGERQVPEALPANDAIRRFNSMKAAGYANLTMTDAETGEDYDVGSRPRRQTITGAALSPAAGRRPRPPVAPELTAGERADQIAEWIRLTGAGVSDNSSETRREGRPGIIAEAARALPGVSESGAPSDQKGLIHVSPSRPLRLPQGV
jgi:hypothetical protein